MISLGAGQSIGAQCPTSNVVTCTITGSLITSGPTNNYQILYQGQLSATAAALYTVPTGDSALISHILLCNNSPSAQVVNLYVNGLAAANIIQSFTIPGYGSATFDRDGWKVYDTNGSLLTTFSGNATSLQGTPVATTAPTSGHVLEYNGTDWVPTTPSVGSLDPQGGSAPSGGVAMTGSMVTVFTTPSLANGTWLITALLNGNQTNLSAQIIAGSATVTFTGSSTIVNGITAYGTVTLNCLAIITTAGTLVVQADQASCNYIQPTSGWTAIKVA